MNANLTKYGQKLLMFARNVSVTELDGVLWFGFDRTYFNGETRRYSTPVGNVGMPVKYIKEQMRAFADTLA